MKKIKSDGGTEFQAKPLQEYFESKRICHLITAPYSPESNGKAERLNRHLIEAGRTLVQELHDNNKEVINYKCLWAEAVAVCENKCSFN